MTDFKLRLDDFRTRYLPEIHRLMDATVRQSAPADSSLPTMYNFHMQTGGKRLRALLPLLLGEALNCDIDPLLPFAAACEMLHNATLVHDDLQDGDRIRRGQDTIWVRFGEAQAINLGDAMFFYAVLLAGQLGVSPEMRQAVIERMSKELVRVIDGQEREFLLKADKAPSLDAYFRMVEGKTSGLFALPLCGTAQLCGASGAFIETLNEAAVHLGVLFQIQDDILDLYGEKGREFRGTDIVEGKISMLVVHFMNHAPAEEVNWLQSLFAQPRESVTQSNIARVAQLFVEHGSLDFALTELNNRQRLAVSAPGLDAFPDVKRLLQDMSEVFIEPIARTLSTHVVEEIQASSTLRNQND